MGARRVASRDRAGVRGLWASGFWGDARLQTDRLAFGLMGHLGYIALRRGRVQSWADVGMVYESYP